MHVHGFLACQSRDFQSGSATACITNYRIYILPSDLNGLMHANPVCLCVETVPLDFISGAYMSTEYGVYNLNLFLAKHRDSVVYVLLWHKQVDQHVRRLNQRPLGKPRRRKHNVAGGLPCRPKHVRRQMCFRQRRHVVTVQVRRRLTIVNSLVLLCSPPPSVFPRMLFHVMLV
jgi:hypothetical protein